MILHVLCDGQHIGEATLAYADPPMEMVWGPFEPLPAYEAVRPLLLLYTESMGSSTTQVDQATLNRYMAARDTHAYHLANDDGAEIAIDAVTIVDWSLTDPELPYEISMQIHDPAFWSGWQRVHAAVADEQP